MRKELTLDSDTIYHLVENGSPLCGFTSSPENKWHIDQAGVGWSELDRVNCKVCEKLAEQKRKTGARLLANISGEE